MKTNAILLSLSLLVLQDIQGADQSEGANEFVIAIGSPPTFGTLNGVKFEHRTVRYPGSHLDVYICYRDRKPTDFKIGERIEYGYLGPVTATSPEMVIDRILLTRPTGEVNARAYYEVPPELYRDVTEPALGKIFASQTNFSLVLKGFTITVFLSGGDGAYSYDANWIIDLENNRVRRVLSNGSGLGPLSPWHALKKIEQPKIVKSPNPDGQQAGADQKAVTKAPIVDLGLQQDAMAIIRKQLALALSENKEQAMLADALAACRRLATPSFIIDLLSDPKYGWNRMAPTTLCHNDDFYTFVIFTYRVHEALFERWGELDLDGALKRLPPPVGGGDFDEGQAITFNLYKGAASVIDGKHVFDTLIPPGSNFGLSEHGSCALGYLIEGWARSDPDAAWIILVSHPSMVNAGRGAIRGYFKGLNSHTPWEKLARKVEAYCAKDQFIAGAEAKGEFRRGLASAWLRHDPAAALTWFASNCNDPHPNYDPDGKDARVSSHAVILTEWLEDDLAGAAHWLASWQSDRISTSAVLAKMARWQKIKPPLNATPKIREAVDKLIRERND